MNRSSSSSSPKSSNFLDFFSVNLTGLDGRLKEDVASFLPPKAVSMSFDKNLSFPVSEMIEELSEAKDVAVSGITLIPLLVDGVGVGRGSVSGTASMALVNWVGVGVGRAVSGTTSIPQVDGVGAGVGVGVGVGTGVGVGLAVSGTMRIPLNDGVGVGGIDLTVDEVPATNTSVSVLDNVDTEKRN